MILVSSLLLCASACLLMAAIAYANWASRARQQAEADQEEAIATLEEAKRLYETNRQSSSSSLRRSVASSLEVQ